MTENICGANSTCQDYDGGFNCTCDAGFEMIDGTCLGEFYHRPQTNFEARQYFQKRLSFCLRWGGGSLYDVTSWLPTWSHVPFGRVSLHRGSLFRGGGLCSGSLNRPGDDLCPGDLCLGEGQLCPGESLYGDTP